MAGALGLEPRTKVLETHVLPLHHTPTSPGDFYIISQRRANVKRKIHFFRRKSDYFFKNVRHVVVSRSNDQAAFAGLVEGSTDALIPMFASR